MSLASLLGLHKDAPLQNGGLNLANKLHELSEKNSIWPEHPLDVETIKALCDFNLQQRPEWIEEIKQTRSVSSLHTFVNERGVLFIVILTIKTNTYTSSHLFFLDSIPLVCIYLHRT